MKKIGILLVLISTLIILNGCGNSPEKQLVGVWNDETGYQVVEFFKDGSYVFFKNSGFEVNGHYKIVSENKIEFTSNQSGLGQDMAHVAGIKDFELDGKVLKFPSLGAAGNVTCYKE